MEIKEKLFNIQQELNAPKSNYSDFGGYNYRSVETILLGLKPLLKIYKCILTMNDSIEMYGDRFYVKATAKLQDMESDGVIETSAYAREMLAKTKMDSSQLTGACSSYARKYALGGMFAIDSEKDADATASKESSIETISSGMYEELARLCVQADRKESYIAKSMKVKTLHDLPKDSYAKVKIALLKIIKEAAENVQE